MPYSFEATFTQPLLQKLDNGLIKGSEDWAKAITEAYTQTMLAGLPQGVPPSLPAPSMQGAPYALPTNPFTTIKQREKLMYNVIHAYFYAKEVKLEKMSIQGLIQSVKQLVAKIKHKQGQLKKIIETVKQLTKEIASIPKLLKEIYSELKDDIKRRIEDVKGISQIVEDMKREFGEEGVKSLFSRELAIIETLKNFKITDIKAVKDLLSFLGSLKDGAFGGIQNPLTQARDYVKTRLAQIATTFTQLSKAVTNPLEVINFVKQLAQESPLLKQTYNKLKKFEQLVRYYSPKLQNLNKRKDQKIEEIRTKLQAKLVEYKKKLDKRIEDFTKQVKSSKAVSLYKNAKKVITDLQKKNEKKIEKVKNTIKLSQKLYRDSLSLYKKSETFVKGLQGEFNAIKEEIKNTQSSIENQVNTVKESVKTSIGSTIVGAQSVADNLKSSTVGVVQTTAPTVSGVQESLTKLDPKNIREELKKQRDYFETQSMGAFANLGALVITQTKCSFDTFKNLFETKRDTIKQYVATLVDIEKDIQELLNTIIKLRGGKSKAASSIKAGIAAAKSFIEGRVKSLKDLIDMLVRKIQPKIKRIQVWASEKIKEVQAYLKNHLNKFKENIKKYVETLKPIQSIVADAKDAKAYIESKVQIIKDKIKKIRDIVKKFSCITKTLKGLKKLLGNVLGGKYKYAENQDAIKDLVDGYFGYKRYANPASLGPLIDKEQQQVEEEMKRLVVIDVLVTGVMESIKELKDVKVLEDIKTTITTLSESPAKKVMQAITTLAENPPKNPKQIKDFIDVLGQDVLQDVTLLRSLTTLEQRHLAKTREIVATMCDVKELEKTKYWATLLTIKTIIKKQQSFLIPTFQAVKKQFASFFIFLENKINNFIKTVKEFLNKKRDKLEKYFKDELAKFQEKKLNIEAPLMSIAFGLATRTLWTGASWPTPTGGNIVTLTIGPFKPIKAKSTDGASKMIKEIAKSFEKQLQQARGLYIPPPPTGIVPVQWTGYK